MFVEGANNQNSAGNSILTSEGDSGPVDVDRGDATNWFFDIDGDQADINVLDGNFTSSGTWQFNGNLGDINAEGL